MSAKGTMEFVPSYKYLGIIMTLWGSGLCGSLCINISFRDDLLQGAVKALFSWLSALVSGDLQACFCTPAYSSEMNRRITGAGRQSLTFLSVCLRGNIQGINASLLFPVFASSCNRSLQSPSSIPSSIQIQSSSSSSVCLPSALHHLSIRNSLNKIYHYQILRLQISQHSDLPPAPLTLPWRLPLHYLSKHLSLQIQRLNTIQAHPSVLFSDPANGVQQSLSVSPAAP